jgi:hypothetical protein
MPKLECSLSPGLWDLLQAHARTTGQPVSHIVSRAIADYLEAAHHTLYQVSTATALVEGIYQGAVRVGNLRQHGDHGLGTFEELDGEEDLVVDALAFLSQHLIVLLDPAQIVANMHAAYRRVRLDATAYGCFMMGPSATADVEATLVHGAQGARSLNVFFMKRT